MTYYLMLLEVKHYSTLELQAIHNMKYIFLLCTLSLISLTVTSQDKHTEKVIDAYKKNADIGISKMDKIVRKDGSNYNWNLLVEMHYRRYIQAVEIEESLTNILLQTEKGGTINKSVSNSEKYKAEMIKTSLEADLKSQSNYASMVLRSFLIDYKPDTAISEEGRKEYELAEEYFVKKNYGKAKEFYAKALSHDSAYYKAMIYLGDSYWHIKQMDSAVYYFRKGIQLYPDLLEPRKYLVDVLAYQEENESAIEECFEAIYLYPDESMYIKLSDLLKRTGYKMNATWIPRNCQINLPGRQEEAVKTEAWKLYQAAKADIEPYCDENGIITKENNLTKARYMEVYCWEKMLADTTSPEEFEFAHKMMKDGYLDCYLFFSLFHHDLYWQYKDFVKDNKGRIRDYVNKYLTYR